ncbi:hypothetical protein CURTO8I2_180169 [Curtobacterium sp. 8I-2]|nr:hypothetical protein CURTO8I2_180169 [Curtobacterium sp. 8I-2]
MRFAQIGPPRSVAGWAPPRLDG